MTCDRNTPSRFMLRKPGISSHAMSQSALRLHFFITNTVKLSRKLAIFFTSRHPELCNWSWKTIAYKKFHVAARSCKILQETWKRKPGVAMCFNPFTPSALISQPHSLWNHCTKLKPLVWFFFTRRQWGGGCEGLRTNGTGIAPTKSSRLNFCSLVPLSSVRDHKFVYRSLGRAGKNPDLIDRGK